MKISDLEAFTVGPARMLARPEDSLAAVYATGRWYEEDLLAAIKGRADGGRFIDIGANHGNHSIYFALECQAESVLAIEPHRGEFSTLAAVIALNDLEEVVRPLRALVHPVWHSASLHGQGARAPGWSFSEQPEISEGGDVPCVTLDDLCRGGVSAIKIDAEDMSVAALASGLNAIAALRPLIAIEPGPFGEEAEDVAAMLTPLGYTIEGVYCATPTYLWIP